MRSIDIADALELDSIVLVMDQAIYAKAQQIRWQNDSLLDRLVIRLGDFHTTMAYMATIGKRFQNSGLEDILIEAEVAAQGSISGVLSGHHYNRSVRAHKLMFEALNRFRWKAFVDSCSDDEKLNVFHVAQNLNSVGPTEKIYEVIEQDDFTEVMDMYDSFVQKERSANPTFDLWSSYIDMVQGLLLLLRGTREGNWRLHLNSLKHILPWFFAYDRINYARYLPAYISEMENLSDTNPEIEEKFLVGEFVVQRQNRYGFSCVVCDMAIEQTANRDSKTKGGMKGLTLNKGAVNRWLLSHHHRAVIAKECQRMAGKDDADRTRKDLDQSQIERDENVICNIIATIQSMASPFEHAGDDLINISSGCVAPEEVKSDLMCAFRIGSDAAKDFENSRLRSESSKIFEPIKTNKLKTFATALKTSKTKIQSEAVQLRATWDMFNRLLIIGKSRNVDLKELLSYSLTPVPLSLGTSDGAICKTNKSQLIHELEKDTECVPNIPVGSALMVDGMAFIQQMQKVPSTFGQLAVEILNNLIGFARNCGCSRVDFVCDRYPSQSIKNCERERRAVCGTQVFKITKPEQKTPKQFKKFLAEGSNKEGLVQFLFDIWVKMDPMLLGEISVVIAHGEECHSFYV